MKRRRDLQALERLGPPEAREVQDFLGYLEGREALGDQRRLGLQGCLRFQPGLLRLPPRQVLDTQ